MKRKLLLVAVPLVSFTLFSFVFRVQAAPGLRSYFDRLISQSNSSLIGEGRETFRYATFGDEAWWGGQLKLHRAIEGSKFGGVGPGLSPAEALAAGLKVDVDALPKKLQEEIKHGKVNLNDPAVTLALLSLNSVVGVTGHFNSDGSLSSVGIQCALCHSSVDNSLVPGIGHRLDGWANRDLNVGAVIGLSPNLLPIAKVLGVDVKTVQKVLASWGPGKFDAELFMDGKAFRPDGKSGATLIPPAFGLAGVNLHTWTGWGSVPYWNAFVGNLEMHGQGNFYDPRLDNAKQFPIAAKNHFGHVHTDNDMISPKLAGLHLYQLSIPAPVPPPGSYNKEAAKRGLILFSGKAQCSSCHQPGTFTDSGWNLHTPKEVCIDGFQANRAPDHRYRTAPLAGLWTHAKDGFYHDGRFAAIGDVVNHYDVCFSLGLGDDEKADLVQYLKSIPANLDAAEQ
jgi:hypothetical protein